MTNSFTGVVIFDGDCPVCSRTAGVIRRMDDVGIISWGDERAQAFLDAEFDDIPFSLVFADIEGETIYIGEAAARVLSERAGVPSMVSTFLEDHYHTMATALQRTVGSGVDPDPVGGRFELTARKAYESMASRAVSVDSDTEKTIDP